MEIFSPKAGAQTALPAPETARASGRNARAGSGTARGQARRGSFFRLFVAFQAERREPDGAIHLAFGDGAGAPAFVGLNIADVNVWVMHVRLRVSRRGLSIA